MNCLKALLHTVAALFELCFKLICKNTKTQMGPRRVKVKHTSVKKKKKKAEKREIIEFKCNKTLCSAE